MAPHAPFKEVESKRPDWEDKEWRYIKTRQPNWKPGDGSGEPGAADKPQVLIDPFAEGRPAVNNYKLLISAIIPRPIGFVSTIGPNGTMNLAPFSYTQLVTHDPPTFIVGISGSFTGGKDTLANLRDSGECTINMASELMAEALNYTSIDSPRTTSEWRLSGLTPAPSSVVKAPRVAEAFFAIEGKVVEFKQFTSPSTGKVSGSMAIVEGVRFWAREEAIANAEQSQLDIAKVKPLCRLGGITYGRVTEGFELPRPVFTDERESGALPDSLLS